MTAFVRLFGRASCVCLVACGLLTVTALVIGRGRTEVNQVQALGLDMCEGRPCFLGLIPAVSTWGEVAGRLSVQYQITNDQRENVYIAEQDNHLSVLVYPDRPGRASGIRRIAVKPFVELANVGNLFLVYGPPCSFLIESDAFASLTYPHMEVFIKFVGQRVSAFSPITSIAIFHTDRTAQCYPDHWRSWAGFKHRTTYKLRWPIFSQCADCGTTVR